MCPPFDVLTCFDDQNLVPFAENTRSVEKALVRTITENGGTLKQYNSFEEFKTANP